MKKTLFVAGLVSGVVLTNWWRSLAKEGIKLGIHAGQRLHEISQKAREELEDVAAEATQEISQQEQAPGVDPQ
jgi:hypothetical protein